MVMHYSTTTGRSPHARQPPALGVLDAITDLLEVSDRQGWLAPSIQPQHRPTIGIDGFKQGLIDCHIFRRIARMQLDQSAPSIGDLSIGDLSIGDLSIGDLSIRCDVIRIFGGHAGLQ
jgi:hypothetical protein